MFYEGMNILFLLKYFDSHFFSFELVVLKLIDLSFFPSCRLTHWTTFFNAGAIIGGKTNRPTSRTYDFLRP